MPKNPEIGKNIKEPFRIVKHTDLERVSDESPFRSWCPVCQKGILLVRRDDNLELSTLDNCTDCGQQFFYEDTEIAGVRLVSPIPLTLEETVTFIDKMLTEEDRKFMQDSMDPEGVVAEVHHSLGRELRNRWGLWRKSPLALYFEKTLAITHPDDMSGKILRNYARVKFPTRYQQIASNADED